MRMLLNFKLPNREVKSFAWIRPFLLNAIPDARPANTPFSLAIEWACRSKITVVTQQGYRDLGIHTC